MLIFRSGGKTSSSYSKSSCSGIGCFTRFFALYTLLFILAAVVVFIPFYARGLTLVWAADGATQYILWLKYTGTWIKGILASLIKGHPAISFYDFTIGLGSDSFPFLKSDPVLLAGSLFVNEKNLAVLYSLLTLLRLYLAGVSFGIFALYRKTPVTGTAFGALVYVFSGYTFYYILRHPQFALGLIYLPLFLTGGRICFEENAGKRKWLFPLVIAVSLMSHYYLHYMNTIVLCVWFVLAYAFCDKKDRSFKPLIRGIIGYVTGFGLAAVFFFPSISMYLFSDRNVLGNASKGNIFFTILRKWPVFSLKNLIHLPGSMIIPANTPCGPASIFVSVLVVPSIVALYARKDSSAKLRLLRATLPLILLCRCMPLVTGIFTMFSTRYDRWAYIAVFVFAWIIAENLQVLCRMPRFKMKYQYVTVVLLILGTGSLMWKGYYYNTGQAGSMNHSFLTEREVLDFYKYSPFEAVKRLNDPAVFRTDTPGLGPYELNGSVASGVMGTCCYQSTINKSIISWQKNMESTDLFSLNLIAGTDQRQALENLLGVKYIVSLPYESVTVPPGFYEDKKAEKKIDDSFKVFANSTPAGFACAYQDAVKESDYMKRSALEKQEILLEYAVLPEEAFKETDIRYHKLPDEGVLVKPVPFKVVKTDRFIRKKGGQYTVDSSDWDEDDPYLTYDEAGGLSGMFGIHFDVDVPADTELYLRISGLNMKEQNTTELFIDTERAHKTVSIQNKANDYYTGLEDYSVYLGYYAQAEKVSGVLSFSNDDEYNIDSIEAMGIPGKREQAVIRERTRNSLKDVNLSGGTITCTVDSNKKPYIVFSIPWQRGWTAYVDGKKTELQRCNDCFTGLSIKGLTDNSHDIRLVFIPFGLYQGLMVSLLSLFGLIISNLNSSSVIR